ncbi:MAG TPA: RluA family pseudouridine synthase [Gaiellaceae bacterium]|nr:RluA family pseudouridine synthase [Gaiellaceae bacterium]
MPAVRVPDEAAGTRLDRFLAGLAEVGTRAAAERLVAEGRATVDGAARPKSHRLEGGETVAFEPPPAVEPEPPPFAVPVVWEDEHLLVVDKPAGLVVHPGAGHAAGTLVDALRGRIAGGDPERPGIVHRLDRDTSGLMVVARSEQAYERLHAMVRDRELGRTYLALVEGRPRSRTGRIEAPIGRDRTDPTRRSLDTDTPKPAVSHFEVERLLDGRALLRVGLETGRTHQIRVHLAAIDLPVVGDRVYGAPDDRLGRQFLHAAALAFEHPFGAGRLELASELPDDLRRFLEALG